MSFLWMMANVSVNINLTSTRHVHAAKFTFENSLGWLLCHSRVCLLVLRFSLLQSASFPDSNMLLENPRPGFVYFLYRKRNTRSSEFIICRNLPQMMITFFCSDDNYLLNWWDRPRNHEISLRKLRQYVRLMLFNDVTEALAIWDNVSGLQH